MLGRYPAQRIQYQRNRRNGGHSSAIQNGGLRPKLQSKNGCAQRGVGRGDRREKTRRECMYVCNHASVHVGRKAERLCICVPQCSRYERGRQPPPATVPRHAAHTSSFRENVVTSCPAAVSTAICVPAQHLPGKKDPMGGKEAGGKGNTRLAHHLPCSSILSLQILSSSHVWWSVEHCALVCNYGYTCV